MIMEENSNTVRRSPDPTQCQISTVPLPPYNENPTLPPQPHIANQATVIPRDICFSFCNAPSRPTQEHCAYMHRLMDLAIQSFNVIIHQAYAGNYHHLSPQEIQGQIWNMQVTLDIMGDVANYSEWLQRDNNWARMGWTEEDRAEGHQRFHRGRRFAYTTFV
ncbi:hypothetical protein ARMGADRAFT_1091744 [Armillaria gallica]|uniref:Uncharacterized protein n=1 Tax=Armillaria gallica TaxID=47427 RepID=A0A2H3CW33_ARMGA|nr:hypothetical protein ARMGADRAFT_1091744 [Armillaria gallica]